MSEKTNKKETEELISDINKSIKAVNNSDFIISINKTRPTEGPTEGCETKLKLFKGINKPDNND